MGDDVRDGFEWDPAKSDDCFERRGFDFYAASSIFQGTYVERFDDNTLPAKTVGSPRAFCATC